MRNDSRFIFKIKEPTIEQCKISIEADFKNIAIVKNPSIELQKFAIDVNKEAIIFIKNQTQEIKDYYISRLSAEEIEEIKPIIEKNKIGNFNENVVNNMSICGKCNLKKSSNRLYPSHCLYSFNNGLYDGCPYFLEHLIKE